MKAESGGVPLLLALFGAVLASVVLRFGARQVVPPRGSPPYWRGSRFVAGRQN